MEKILVSTRTKVADVLAGSKQVAALFVELRVDCVGCGLNKFCTLEDLCSQYELDLEELILKIKQRLNQDPDV